MSKKKAKAVEVTVAQLAELRGDKNSIAANALINQLNADGKLKVVGKIQSLNPDGTPKRGKPAKIYRVPQNAMIQLFSDDQFEAHEARLQAEAEAKAAEAEVNDTDGEVEVETETAETETVEAEETETAEEGDEIVTA